MKITALIGTLCFAASTCSLAQSNPSLLPSYPATAQNLLIQATHQIGIQRCATAIDQISSRALTGAVAHDIVLDWDRRNPDLGPLFSLIGMQFPKSSALLSLTTIPLVSGEACAILVERISSAPITCHEVARSELSGYKSTELVRAVTVYTVPARPTETVTLVDAAQSCVIVRRQVEYNWPVPRK